MDFDFTTLPNEDAARAIAYKTPVGRKVFDKLLPELKARAFVVTGLEELRALRAIRDAIAELPRGLDWDTVKKKVMAELYAGDFSEKACEARAELLIRHHGFMAYSMADYEVKQQVKDSFPYWKYQTMGDHRVRASHAALDGLVLPADHPFWKDHYPPWEWGCRCQIIEITEDEYNEIKGRTPGSFNPTEDEKAQGWTLTPEGEKRLRDYGTLDDGSGVPVDVRSPRAKDGPEAYGWSPGESGLSLKDLEKKYGEEDFGKFRDIMRQCDIGDGRNAWDWLEGKKPPAPSGSAVVPPAKNAGEPSASRHAGRTATPRQDADVSGTGAAGRSPPPGARRQDSVVAGDPVCDVLGCRKGMPFSIEDAAAMANPRYSEGTEYRTNCACCVQAYELARRGYTVEALPASRSVWMGDEGFVHGETGRRAWMKHHLTKDQFLDAIRKAPDGARFIAEVRWIDGTGHGFNVEKIGGTIRFVNPQNPRRDAKQNLDIGKQFGILRVDNLEVDPAIVPKFAKRG